MNFIHETARQPDYSELALSSSSNVLASPLHMLAEQASLASPIETSLLERTTIQHRPFIPPDANYLQCDICLLKFEPTKKSALQAHMYRHKKGTSLCPHCNETFSSNSSLNIHIQNIHDYQPSAKCTTCKKTFKTIRYLKSHNARPCSFNPCNVCHNYFTSPNALAEHQKMHDQTRQFKCHLCSYAFNKKQSLIDHFRTHSKKKPFKCKTCPKSFSRKGVLKQHEKTHNPNPQKFACKHCNKLLKTLRSLESHILKCKLNPTNITST